MVGCRSIWLNPVTEGSRGSPAWARQIPPSFLSLRLSAMSSAVRQTYDHLCKLLNRAALLRQVSAVLEWDQQTFMPSSEGTARSRGAQLEVMAGVIHDAEVDPEIGKLLTRLRDPAVLPELSEWEQAVVRDSWRDFRRSKAVPKELAERRARLQSEGYSSWAEARAKKDWSLFAPTLQQLLDNTMEYAHCVEPELAAVDPYAVMLDQFERGMTPQRVDGVFARIKERLVPLTQAVFASSVKISQAPFTEGAPFAIEKQKQLNEEIATALGFDFSRGRLDVSLHPFSTSFGKSDVRITTRYKESEWFQALSGLIHETGHSFYERQLPDGNLPTCSSLSMGVHESQSLFWERHIGLSPAFWRFAAPLVEKNLGVRASPEELHKAANGVEAGFIRVEADELTYPLHVILRFEIERDLFSRKLAVADVPAAWSEKMKDFFGLDVPDVALGAAQDIHWSGAAFGYFPTYLLGAAYSAQIFRKISQEIGNLDELVQNGKFEPILHWLGEKIHRQGSFFTSADDLLRFATGEPLNVDYLLDYLEGKYRQLYGLQ